MSSNKKNLATNNTTLVLSALFLCISIVALWISDRLTRYIHPRYELFTLVLVVFGGLVLVIYLFSSQPAPKQLSLSAKLTLLFCASALLLPVQTLSSRAALNREQSNYSVDEVSTSSFDEFSKDYSNLSISEWSSLLSKRPPIDEIGDKTATIEGFALYDEGQVSIARFRISCCSVDATPLSIQVSNDTSSQFTENNWYIVTGSFSLEGDDYILTPTEITPIEEPDNPYVF